MRRPRSSILSSDVGDSNSSLAYKQSLCSLWPPSVCATPAIASLSAADTRLIHVRAPSACTTLCRNLVGISLGSPARLSGARAHGRILPPVEPLQPPGGSAAGARAVLRRCSGGLAAPSQHPPPARPQPLLAGEPAPASGWACSGVGFTPGRDTTRGVAAARRRRAARSFASCASPSCRVSPCPLS